MNTVRVFCLLVILGSCVSCAGPVAIIEDSPGRNTPVIRLDEGYSSVRIANGVTSGTVILPMDVVIEEFIPEARIYLVKSVIKQGEEETLSRYIGYFLIEDETQSVLTLGEDAVGNLGSGDVYTVTIAVHNTRNEEIATASVRLIVEGVPVFMERSASITFPEGDFIPNEALEFLIRGGAGNTTALPEAIDPNGDSVQYRLQDTLDVIEGRFVLVTNQDTFAREIHTTDIPLDYESSRREYRLFVLASKFGSMDYYDKFALTVSLNDTDEAPTLSISSEYITVTIPENARNGVPIIQSANLDSGDPDILSTAPDFAANNYYHIIAVSNLTVGTNVLSDGLFTNDTNTGQIVLDVSGGVAEGEEYLITFYFRSGISGALFDSLYAETNITVMVGASNNVLFSGDMQASVNEDASSSAVVMSLPMVSAGDSNSSSTTYSYELEAGVPFEISGTDVVVSGVLDYETQRVYNLSLTATNDDMAAESASALLTIAVNDINDNVPSLVSLHAALDAQDTPIRVDENTTYVTTLRVMDLDQVNTFVLSVDVPSQLFFEVNGNYQLVFMSAPDYESGVNTSYTVTVIVNDGERDGEFLELTINVHDLDD